MGSWTELDAIYPPGTLTPATALIVALGRLSGAESVYAGDEGVLADFLPRRGIAYDIDLLGRAEHYLREVPTDQFLVEAREILNPQQKRCLLINLLDRVLAGEAGHKADRFYEQVRDGLGFSAEDMLPYRQALAIKNDLAVFPQ